MSRIVTSLPHTELEVADGNFDTNRAPIDRVILHTMVGTWQGAAARFDNPTSQVSAHYGVTLTGELIHWLEETFTAYHAGDLAMNRRSIGIEHEDGGDYNGTRPDVLYTESAKLVRDICQYYQIPIDRQHIFKHSEVSDAPTGCPDALDVDRIVREAAAGTPAPSEQVSLPKATFEELVGKASRYDTIDQAGFHTYADIQTKLYMLQKMVDDQGNDLKAKAQQITKLQADLSACQKAVPQTPPAPGTPPTQPKPTPPPGTPPDQQAFYTALWQWLKGFFGR